MIRAVFHHDRQGRIRAFRMEGHAKGWRPWPDIICAAVSAIAQTVIGSLEELVEIQADYGLQKGDISCRLVYPDDEDQARQVATLMASARIGCLQIQDSYGKKYLTVIDQAASDTKGENHD